MESPRGAIGAMLIVLIALIGAVLYWQFGRNEGASATAGRGNQAWGFDEGVIAAVDGRPIHLEEWQARVGAVSPEQSRRLLQGEVRRRAVLAVAEDAGYAQRMEVRERLEEAMVALYLREAVADSVQSIQVSNAEFEAYLSEHPIDPPQPLRRAAILRREIGPDDDVSEARAMLQSAREEALALTGRIAHFGTVATRVSDHRGSRSRGGVLGYFNQEHSPYDNVPEGVHAALWALDAPGDISEVVDANGVLYLVRFVDEHIRPGQDPESQRAVARERLLIEKRQAARRAMLEAIERQAEVSIAPDWQAPSDGTAPRQPPASPITATAQSPENPS